MGNTPSGTLRLTVKGTAVNPETLNEKNIKEAQVSVQAKKGFEKCLPAYVTPKTSVTWRQIDAVYETWGIITTPGTISFEIAQKKFPNAQLTPRILFYNTYYKRLLQTEPSLKTVFEGNMVRQSKSLGEMTSCLVSMARYLKEGKCIEKMTECADHNTTLGIRPEHYDSIGRALLHAVAHCAGPQIWTSEVAQSWGSMLSMYLTIVVPRSVIMWREKERPKDFDDEDDDPLASSSHLGSSFRRPSISRSFHQLSSTSRTKNGSPPKSSGHRRKSGGVSSKMTGLLASSRRKGSASSAPSGSPARDQASSGMVLAPAEVNVFTEQNHFQGANAMFSPRSPRSGSNDQSIDGLSIIPASGPSPPGSPMSVRVRQPSFSVRPSSVRTVPMNFSPTGKSTPPLSPYGSTRPLSMSMSLSTVASSLPSSPTSACDIKEITSVQDLMLFVDEASVGALCRNESLFLKIIAEFFSTSHSHGVREAAGECLVMGMTRIAAEWQSERARKTIKTLLFPTIRALVGCLQIFESTTVEETTDKHRNSSELTLCGMQSLYSLISTMSGKLDIGEEARNDIWGAVAPLLTVRDKTIRKKAVKILGKLQTPKENIENDIPYFMAVTKTTEMALEILERESAARTLRERLPAWLDLLVVFLKTPDNLTEPEAKLVLGLVETVMARAQRAKSVEESLKTQSMAGSKHGGKKKYLSVWLEKVVVRLLDAIVCGGSLHEMTGLHQRACSAVAEMLTVLPLGGNPLVRVEAYRCTLAAVSFYLHDENTKWLQYVSAQLAPMVVLEVETAFSISQHDIPSDFDWASKNNPVGSSFWCLAAFLQTGHVHLSNESKKQLEQALFMCSEALHLDPHEKKLKRSRSQAGLQSANATLDAYQSAASVAAAKRRDSIKGDDKEGKVEAQATSAAQGASPAKGIDQNRESHLSHLMTVRRNRQAFMNLASIYTSKEPATINFDTAHFNSVREKILASDTAELPSFMEHSATVEFGDDALVAESREHEEARALGDMKGLLDSVLVSPPPVTFEKAQQNGAFPPEPGKEEAVETGRVDEGARQMDEPKTAG
ncbi:unnamed protein product [Chrysoparadoxa australica]